MTIFHYFKKYKSDTTAISENVFFKIIQTYISPQRKFDQAVWKGTNWAKNRNIWALNAKKCHLRSNRICRIVFVEYETLKKSNETWKTMFVKRGHKDKANLILVICSTTLRKFLLKVLINIDTSKHFWSILNECYTNVLSL